MSILYRIFRVSDGVMDANFRVCMADGTHAMLDCYGLSEYRINVDGKEYRFEMSSRFGPSPIKNGRVYDLTHKDPFWRAVSLWCLQGKRTQGDLAIWHEPKKPEYDHVSGRSYLIIKDGEPGWDW